MVDRISIGLLVTAIVFVLQGGWEQDEVIEKAAKRETVEEAGVRGELRVSLEVGS